MKIICVFQSLLITTIGRKGFGPGEQDWGYVTVRPGTQMFWWLYLTSADVSIFTQRPLIIWLQGGPGCSSTGYGNFEEIGPLDADFNLRNHTWVKTANILFIDNPVGTGFSYVNNTSELSTTNKQIADDLVTCLREFYNRYPQFQNVALYIAGESYGGKMTVEFAYELLKRANSYKSNSNLRGICLIDSFISPVDTASNLAPYLYYIGAIDRSGYKRINSTVTKIKIAANTHDFEKAKTEWENLFDIVRKASFGIDWYNILTKISSKDHPSSLAQINDKLDRIMNSHVKKKLGLTTIWNGDYSPITNAIGSDFMKPVTDTVERLLNETQIKIQVITGQLDLIVTTAGTISWVDSLKWTQSVKWEKTSREVLSVNGINEGYKKSLGRLALYWINRSGHMVPKDNPAAMGAILDELINDQN